MPLRISIWGRRNPKTAVLIIAIFQLLLGGLSVLAGVLVFEAGIGVMQWMLTTAVVILSLIFYYYPDTHANYFFKPRLYARQKFADFSLVLMIQVVIVMGVALFMARDHYPSAKYHIPVVEAALHPIDVDKQPTKFEQSINPINKGVEKLKLKIRATLMDMKLLPKLNKVSGHDDWERGGLIFGAILLIILMVFGVAFLTCSLLCNGHNAIAAIVGFGGMIGIIMLSIKMFKSINKRKRLSNSQ